VRVDLIGELARALVDDKSFESQSHDHVSDARRKLAP
jgi:hypothetical protein